MSKQHSEAARNPVSRPRTTRQEGPTQPTPEDLAISAEGLEEPPHAGSLSWVAAEAMRSGIFPEAPQMEQIPGQDELLRAGDPDVSPLDNEYVGTDIPGGATPTPDQSGVDEIGRAYGIAPSDSGPLVLGEQVLIDRDANREELDSSSPMAVEHRKATDPRPSKSDRPSVRVARAIELARPAARIATRISSPPPAKGHTRSRAKAFRFATEP